VKLTYGGKNHSLGYFADEHAAAMAYDEAARRVLGESAAPNFLTAEETAELQAREEYEERARTKVRHAMQLYRAALPVAPALLARPSARQLGPAAAASARHEAHER